MRTFLSDDDSSSAGLNADAGSNKDAFQAQLDEDNSRNEARLLNTDHFQAGERNLSAPGNTADATHDASTQPVIRENDTLRGMPAGTSFEGTPGQDAGIGLDNDQEKRSGEIR